MMFFRRTDEQDSAIRGVLRPCDPPNHDGLSVQRFTCKSGIESRAERILAEHTNGEGVALACRDYSRPFDEPGKVIEIGGLDLVFIWLCLLRRQDGHPKKYGHEDYRQRSEKPAPKRQTNVSLDGWPAGESLVSAIHGSANGHLSADLQVTFPYTLLLIPTMVSTSLPNSA